MLFRRVQNRIQLRIVIHFHLFVNLHVLTPRGDIFEQLVDRRGQVVLLLPQYGQFSAALFDMLQ